MHNAPTDTGQPEHEDDLKFQHPFDPKLAAAALRRAHQHSIQRVFGRQSTLLGDLTDQRTPEGRQNPYWDLLLTVPARENMEQLVVEIPLWTDDPDLTVELVSAGMHFDSLRPHYAWSIPSPSDLDTIVGCLRPGQGVVEVCAGSGYWAWMLAQYGLDVAAYDQTPGGPDSGNWFARGGPWHPVREGGPQSAADHPDRALLLCWPPVDSPVAAQTLAAYRGDTVILALHTEASGNPDFYAAVRRDWDKVAEADQHVSILGMEDQIVVLRRRAEPRAPGEPLAAMQAALADLALVPFTRFGELASLFRMLAPAADDGAWDEDEQAAAGQ